MSEPHLPEKPLPQRPRVLPELTEATLAALGTDPLSANIILGGGVALKHYDDFRETQDIDAWWRQSHDPATLESVRSHIERVAWERGYNVQHRQFGATDSLELTSAENNRKVFSFRISLRDTTLEDPLVSAWPPLLIETLRDNIGSTMNALVNRGAPRDLLDIFRVVQDRLVTTAECWNLWQMKNERGDPAEAKGRVLTYLTRLEQRRPLEAMADSVERQTQHPFGAGTAKPF